LNVKLLILATYLCIFIPVNSEAQSKKNKKSNCELAELAGTWYGTYETSGGSIYQMSMEINPTASCTFEGFQYWPEYYNSKSSIAGSLENQAWEIKETAILQGYYTVTGIVQNGSLNGDSLRLESRNANGVVFARMLLVHSRSVTEQTINDFKGLVLESQAKYGNALFLKDKPDLSAEQLLEKHKARYPETVAEQHTNFKITGNLQMNDLTVPMTVWLKHPDKMLLEVKFQGVSYLHGQNGTISWEYNGLEDLVTVEDQTDNDDGNSFTASDLDDVNLEDYSSATVSMVQIDSIKAYRLLLLDEDSDWVVYYLDTDQHLMVRSENSEGIEYRFEYQNIMGELIPTLYYQITLEQSLRYKFDEIKVSVELPDSIFDMTAEMEAKAKRQAARNDTYYYELGNTEFENGNYQAAEEAYNKAINLNGKLSYYLNRGRARMGLESYYEAISDFTLVLETEPNYAKAYNFRGLTKYYLKDYKSALVDLDKAIELDPDLKDAYNNRLYTYSKTGDYNEALSDLDRLLELAPEDGRYPTFYGILLAELDRYEEALAKYQSAIAMDFEDEGIFNYKGVTHYYLQQYDSATIFFKKALAQDTTNTQVISNLVNSYFELEDYQQSVQYLSAGLAINPDNHTFHNSLGLAMQYLDDYELSLQHFNQAISIHNQDADYFHNRAETYYALQRFSQALEDFSTAIDLDSDNGNAFYKRGLVKITMNNRFDACRDFQKAVELGITQAQEKVDEHCISVEENDQ